MHEYSYNAVPLVNPPLLPSLIYSAPLCTINYPSCLLGDPFSCDHGANVHPLSSLADSQLFTPCCSTHPEDTHGSNYVFT